MALSVLAKSAGEEFTEIQLARPEAGRAGQNVNQQREDGMC